MKISSSTDYSSIFSSLNTNNDMGFSLTDYASIKNGSYGKLVKAYYGKNSTSGSNSSVSKSLTETQTKNLSATKTAAENLKTATGKLAEEIKNGDDEKIYKAVAELSNKYNDLVSAAKTSDNSSVTKTAQRMLDGIASNLSLLGKAGISLDDTTGKMSVNEEKVKSNITALKSLFTGSGSLGDSISSRASSIARAASSALNTSKNYTSGAKYDNSTYVGELYDTYN